MSSKLLRRAARALVVLLVLSTFFPAVSSAAPWPREEGAFLNPESVRSWWETVRTLLLGPSPKPVSRTRSLAKEGIGIDPNGSPRPTPPPPPNAQTTSDGGQ